MTHPKPDNAPAPTGPVLSAEQIAKDLIATWLSPFYGHGGIRDGIILAINNERDILAQRDKRVEELDKDRERLDWLEKNHGDMECCERTPGVIQWEVDSHDGHYEIGDSIRAAIDAAMKEAE